MKGRTVPHGDPVILGVRHHSPACARLVAARIRALRPAFVLIEGPADFNGRLDELYLPHRLPVAIYSYLARGDGHRGSWTPFAEHSPEWQALQAGREAGAQVRFIDLPAWHGAFAHLENRYADAADAQHQARAEAYERALAEKLAVQGRDALWDHLFEDGAPAPAQAGDGGDDGLALRLSTYFGHLRGEDEAGSAGNQARERMMARWIAWAMAQGRGPVLVVCGGYHAPALARLWREMPGDEPETPQPGDADLRGADGTDDTDDSADDPDAIKNIANYSMDPAASVRFGSYIVPYTFRRLDAFAGYASGMPSPQYYQWLWEHGAEGAAREALRSVVQRLRERKLPASTADLMAVHARALGLARLRGHHQPLRSDWLDALAGALVKEALDAPLPWTYRGPLRPGTDPVLVQAMDVLAGNTAGRLAPGTPQPPLVAAVRAELAAHGLPPRGTVTLDLLQEGDRARSRVLHRLALLELPGVARTRGPALALSGERGEAWSLSEPMEQQAALIEAGAWGATLEDAARARLEDSLRQARGRIVPLAEGLNRAAWAGLSALSDGLLRDIGDAIAQEPRFEALAPALGLLHTLLRHGQMLGMAGAPVLRVAVEAGFDRALWLLEAPAAVAPADTEDHLRGHRALHRIVADTLADRQDGAPDPLALEPVRAFAVWQRKAADPQAAPISRGAALGAVLALSGRLDASTPSTGVQEAMDLLGAMTASTLGDALAGLLALAREALATEPAFAAGMDRRVRALDDEAFVQALPALRAAFAWLPPRERGDLADQVLALHGAQHLPRRTLTAVGPGSLPPETLARARAGEAAAAARLAAWGIDAGTGAPP
ncbi:DUF5682 family protein [Paracidovorax konjaci]|uniref:Uncharacterized protein n=1 Tax=Paracidovorax konjaci TaxID=32040 RepID=A0A1I1SRJ4_9BURK|nr:DUF5682 family protein [Paracidovorax konjaci]SFD45690.1 hypothetical protein SAMN04489710_102209 [Paracidovorax konjaci]